MTGWGITFIMIFLVLVTGIVLVFTGIFNKRKALVYVGLPIILITCVAGLIEAYQVFERTMEKAKKMLEPRSGVEVYKGLFGEPASGCVKVIHVQDQVLPRIDNAIWIHIKTCPTEMKRVLSEKDFEQNEDKAYFTDGPEWFDSALLGDSIQTFIYRKEDLVNLQILYLNKDSSECFCKDSQD